MKYFSITELCASVRAEELELQNNPTPEACDNLIALTEHVLDPAREALRRAIHVNCGYRSPELNAAVGGVEDSQHSKGEAADIELDGRSSEENKELYDWIVANCEFDQIINEYDFSWIHVSFREGNNRRMQLKIG